jgi:LPXTG-motif cell wall-anchored protein
MKRLNETRVVRVTRAIRGPSGEGKLESSAIGAPTRRLSILITAVMIFVVVLAQLASAQTSGGFSLTIPLDTVVFIPPDTNLLLATEPVPEEFAGHSCGVTGISRNQDSVHPDNDLFIRSGTSEVVLQNVEDDPGGSVEGAGTLVLDSEVTVTLHMGPDAVFSAGLDVVIDCTQVTPTTIETTTTSTTLLTTTTSTSVPGLETTTTVEDEVLGTVVTSSTLGDDVGDLDELPFTGPRDGAWLMIGGSLLALGGILVVGTRRRQEDR